MSHIDEINKSREQGIARDQARSTEKQANYSQKTAEIQLKSLTHIEALSKAMLDLIKSLQALTDEQKNQNEILQNEITLKNKYERREKILFWLAIGINTLMAISSIYVLISR